ncbi:type I-E CRISPR-associated endoribonuclease Cas2e [Pararhodospirillum photometricum]|uniref:CRISPR-associated protein Cas2, putative n=1 Tax=Pararhodospirillum photometricum DSM 122 TaxID=1150469 RepID=H6SSP2_PARPM|nr:type I-E CRISPR-associated endoribonuclease Cas2e [Pararhodospirillum photometricum]CCG07921.1 CRISPR-associated protein Cas2, putative [Pararhodospirillum photometricum DSM 122]
MILICASNTVDRVHGFLRSCMLNPHPGVYVSVTLDAGSRERVWTILEGWWNAEPQGTLLMMYKAKEKPMGLDFRSLGVPKRTVVERDGIYMLITKTKNTESP